MRSKWEPWALRGEGDLEAVLNTSNSSLALILSDVYLLRVL